MTAPERIWAYPSYVTGWSSAIAHDRQIIDSTEYTRTDTIPAMIARVLEEAAKLIESAETERCGVCGRTKNNHQVRHPFQGTGIRADAAAIRALAALKGGV